jgi:hypothetical protein
MASIVPYTKKMLAQRIIKHINDGYPKSEFATTLKETILYIDQAIAFFIVGKAYENAKLEGVLVTPEAFLRTYTLSALSQDSITKYWNTTLPQPPLSLPLGYSVTRVYTAQNGTPSRDFIPIRNKRLGYRFNLPTYAAVFYWVENEKLWLWSTDNSPLSDYTIYVQMPSSRTEDENDTMALPDDIIQPVFDKVVSEILQRIGTPKDIIKDDLTQGNKSS